MSGAGYQNIDPDLERERAYMARLARFVLAMAQIEDAVFSVFRCEMVLPHDVAEILRSKMTSPKQQMEIIKKLTKTRNYPEDVFRFFNQIAARYDPIQKRRNQLVHSAEYDLGISAVKRIGGKTRAIETYEELGQLLDEAVDFVGGLRAASADIDMAKFLSEKGYGQADWVKPYYELRVERGF